MKTRENYWFLVLSFCVASFCSCENRKDTEKLSAADIAIMRNSNPDIAKFREITKKSIQNIAYNKYNLSGVDNAYIKKNAGTAKTMEEMIAVYQKAGMTNAGEYISLAIQTFYYLSKIKKADPRVAKMNRAEFSQLINGEVSPDSPNLIDPKEYIRLKNQLKI